jgi:peptidoglycan hydrolase-like protein with peptidoglycan-binding domain
VTGEEKQKNEENKGFAGLSSLVSDVDMRTPHVPKVEPVGPEASAKQSAPETDSLQLSQQRQPYQEPVQPSSPGSSGGKWLVGIVSVISVLWFIWQQGNSSTSRDYSSSALTETPNYSLPPAELQASSRPQESMPPAGQDLVFSVAQIRYCLAEDIRLEGAKSAINNYIDSDIDRFNQMVSDYNSRCERFRYRNGTLENARRDIESYRSQLQLEGRNRFTSSSTSSSLYRPAQDVTLSNPVQPRPVQDATVLSIQRKLNELGYNAGVADGLMGKGTRSAIIAFQQNTGLAATGVADQVLLLQLEQAPPTKSAAPSSVAPSDKRVIGESSNNKITIPANSFQYTGSAKGWACNTGYRDTGDDCAYINKPQNSFHYTGSAKGWACNPGYRDTGDDCAYINKPQNSFHYTGSAKGWACNTGYKEIGDECWKVEASR